MTPPEGGVPCAGCPCRTPFKGSPEVIQGARDLHFEGGLDKGIEQAVVLLISAGVETFESCEGGSGHSFPEPTIKFEGDRSEGYRAVAAALTWGLPVSTLRRVWAVLDSSLHGPWWELTFRAPREGERTLGYPEGADAS